MIRRPAAEGNSPYLVETLILSVRSTRRETPKLKSGQQPLLAEPRWYTCQVLKAAVAVGGQKEPTGNCSDAAARLSTGLVQSTTDNRLIPSVVTGEFRS